jgi:hypothetical protein
VIFCKCHWYDRPARNDLPMQPGAGREHALEGDNAMAP